LTTKAVPRTAKDVDPGKCSVSHCEVYHHDRDKKVIVKIKSWTDSDKGFYEELSTDQSCKNKHTTIQFHMPFSIPDDIYLKGSTCMWFYTKIC